jgi:hypothetical protein
MRSLGWVLVACLATLPAAANADECRPSDGTRIQQTSATSSLVTLTWDHPETPITLQVSADEDFAKRLIDRSIPCCDAKLRNLERGRYYWRTLEEGQETCRASFEIVPQGEP